MPRSSRYDGDSQDDAEQRSRSVAPVWVESRLDNSCTHRESNEYLFDRFTAADVLMTTVLRMLRDTDFVEKRPLLDAYQRHCEGRPAFRKALEDQLAGFAKHALNAARPADQRTPA